MKTYKEYKESFMKENPIKLNEEEKSSLISIDIQLDENNTKKFELNSSDDLDNKLNAFCEENNLPDSAKKYIHNSILEKISQNKIKCKYIFYIYFSRRRFISKKEYNNRKTKNKSKIFK